MAVKYYICERCKNIITYLNQSAVPVMCCGQKMAELVPGTTDAAQEKHVPVITKDGDTVTVSVGAVAHPMTEQHYIQWIVLETKQGIQRKMLTPTSEPKAVFALCPGDEVEAAYAYCNLHSLWKA
ncbi:MAG: desulfoferrodoxin [Oscillospiraceae bacterium]|nr:desulfoferrodoxin [Oscillospiraceae bacterium]